MQLGARPDPSTILVTGAFNLANFLVIGRPLQLASVPIEILFHCVNR